MKTLILILFFPFVVSAQRGKIHYKDTIIANVTFVNKTGMNVTPKNVWKINFKNDSTMLVTYRDSTKAYYKIQAIVKLDINNIPSPIIYVK